MPQAQQMQQVIEDDQPMMLNNVVPVAIEVSPAAKNPDRGGRKFFLKIMISCLKYFLYFIRSSKFEK